MRYLQHHSAPPGRCRRGAAEPKAALENRIERESQQRDAGLELAIREVRVDLRLLQAQVADSSDRLDAMLRVESRVAALEKRLA